MTSVCLFNFSLFVKNLYTEFRRHFATYTYIETVEPLKPINRSIVKFRNSAVCLKNKNVIEVLYTGHCSFWKGVTKTIEEILKESQLKASIKRVKISSENEAKRLKFRFSYD